MSSCRRHPLGAVWPNGNFRGEEWPPRKIKSHKAKSLGRVSVPARLGKGYVVRIGVAMTNRTKPPISTEISTSDGNVFEQELSRGEQGRAEFRPLFGQNDRRTVLHPALSSATADTPVAALEQEELLLVSQEPRHTAADNPPEQSRVKSVDAQRCRGLPPRLAPRLASQSSPVIFAVGSVTAAGGNGGVAVPVAARPSERLMQTFTDE